MFRREVFLGEHVPVDAGEQLGVWRFPVVDDPGLLVSEVLAVRQVAGELLALVFVYLFGKLELDDGSKAPLHVPRRSAGADPDIASGVKLDLSRIGNPGREAELDEPFGFRVEPVQGVVSGPADPYVAAGVNVERVGDLVFGVRQVIDGPFLGFWIKFTKHARGEPGYPDNAVLGDMKSPGAAEWRVPLLDVAVRGPGVDASNAVTVELGVPDASIYGRIVQAVRSDAARFTFPGRDGLVRLQELVLLDLEGGRMKGEAGVPARVGVPDESLGIFGVDAKGVGVGSPLRWGLGARADGVFLGIEVKFSHLPAGANGQPHVAIIGQFDGVRAIGPTRQLVGALITGVGVQRDNAVFADVDRVDQPIWAEFQVVEGALKFLAKFPRGDPGLRRETGRRRGGDENRPFPDRVVLVGIRQALDDGFLRVSIESAEAIHSTHHGFPVNRLLRGPEAYGSHLVAIAAHHLEVELVSLVVEFQHAEAAAGGALVLEIVSCRGLELESQLCGAGSRPIGPFVIEAHEPRAHIVFHIA